jgi:hypothetical protein
LPPIDELDEKAATREDSYDANLSQPANASCCVTSRPLTSIAATALTHAQPARLSECGKSQKRLATRRVSSTAAETAVMATILIRLRAAIDSVRFAFAFLHFDFCDARIACPRRRVRLLGSLTLTLSHLTRNNARGQVAPATSIQVG